MPLSETVESAVMEWILERRTNGLRVSSLLIMKQVKVCVYEHYVETSNTTQRKLGHQKGCSNGMLLISWFVAIVVLDHPSIT